MQRPVRTGLPRQPTSLVFTVICEWAFEIPRFRAIRGILRRLCVSDRAPKASFPPPVSEGYFSCLVFDGAFGLRSSRSHQRRTLTRVSVGHVQHLARGSTGSGYPGPGRGEVADGSAASAKSRWCERFGRPPFRLAHADLAVQTSLGQGLRGSRRSTVPG
jgi:hypothetical protein